MLTVYDFTIVKDEFGFKLINQHKLKEGLKNIDPSNYFEYKKVWRSAHTHLHSKRMCMVMRDNLIKCKIPTTTSERLLKSHIRIAEDEKYIETLKQLVNTRKKKGRQEYINERNEMDYKVKGSEDSLTHKLTKSIPKYK